MIFWKNLSAYTYSTIHNPVSRVMCVEPSHSKGHDRVEVGLLKRANYVRMEQRVCSGIIWLAAGVVVVLTQTLHLPEGLVRAPHLPATASDGSDLKPCDSRGLRIWHTMWCVN